MTPPHDLLENNAVVRFPPHLGEVLAQPVHAHGVVRVEGAFWVPATIHASSIVNLQNQRTVIDVPPLPKRPRRPVRAACPRQSLIVHGAIRVLTHGRHGEVLSDGTIVHFPPHGGTSFAVLLGAGSFLAATGHGTSNEHGRSLEAEALGPSPAQLPAITPGPGGPPSARGTTTPSP